MASLLDFFSPPNRLFFQLFNESAANALDMSRLLHKAITAESNHDKIVKFNDINALKKKGNELKRKIYLVSSKRLISPFERNDMFALSTVITSFSNSIDLSARRIHLYKPKSLEASVKELSSLIVNTSEELNASVQTLNDLKKSDQIIDCCNRIKAVEHYANKVYTAALSNVNAEIDPIEFIKYTDILGSLEKTIDKCAESTVVIESILIKNN